MLIIGLWGDEMKKGIYYTVRVNIKGTLVIVLVVLLSVASMLGVSAKSKDEVALPIVMYHALLRDPARQGTYVVSPEQFEADLIYLKEHGYEPVLIADLIAYTKGDALPSKPVLITFDDGYYNNYYYGFEIAKRLRCKFVVSPIGILSDKFTETGEENPNYSHLTWPHLREMAQSGLVEIQSHSYDLHHNTGTRFGIRQKNWETKEAYFSDVGTDILLSKEKIAQNVGISPTAFAYPYGAKGSYAPTLIRHLGFSASLTSEEKISVISRDPDSLYELGRFVRPAGISSADFFESVMGLPSSSPPEASPSSTAKAEDTP